MSKLYAIILHPSRAALEELTHKEHFSMGRSDNLSIFVEFLEDSKFSPAGCYSNDKDKNAEDFLESVFDYANTNEDYLEKHRSMSVGDVVMVYTLEGQPSTFHACMSYGFKKFA